jgi:WD40 repeat protein/uncharacterized caspase-like protein
VIIWDFKTGRELRRLHGKFGGVVSLAFSPDGGTIAIGHVASEGEEGLPLYRTNNGELIRNLPTGFGALCGLSFSADGKHLISAGAELIRWEISTGKVVWKVTMPDAGHRELFVEAAGFRALAMSKDGTILATADWKNRLRLWDASTGKNLRDLDWPLTTSLLALAFTPEGDTLLAGGERDVMERYETKTGKTLTPLRPKKGKLTAVVDVGASANGKLAYAVDRRNAIALWAAESGEVMGTLNTPPELGRITSASGTGGSFLLGLENRLAVALSTGEVGTKPVLFRSEIGPVIRASICRDGKTLLAVVGRQLTRWSLRNGRMEDDLNEYRSPLIGSLSGLLGIASVSYSPDGGQFLVCGENGLARVRDTESGKLVRSFSGHSGILFGGAWSLSARRVLTHGEDKKACVWDSTNGRQLACIEQKEGVAAGCFSLDEKSVVLIAPLDERNPSSARLYDIASRSLVRSFEIGENEFPVDLKTLPQSNDVLGLVMSPNNSWLLVWSPETGKIVKRIQVFNRNDMTGVTTSPDGRFGLVYPSTFHSSFHSDYPAILFDLETGKEVQRFTGHHGLVNSAAFLPGGEQAITMCNDGCTRFWDVKTGKEICRIVRFLESGWAVTTPAGQFDANDLDLINGFHWVVSDEPFRPLPPEIFMRDYYEPRLLARVLAGEAFKPVRSLAELNRVQPSVKVKKVEMQPDYADEVIVTVEVADQSGIFTRSGKRVELHSGVYDVHLFRDGQLVGRQPSDDGEVALDPKNGRATLRFEHVRLPRRKGQKVAEFSAYAFNVDRVKSPTHRMHHPLPADLAPRKGTAYLVCVGVNAFDSPSWDLRFAVPDAKLIAQSLRESLARSGQFERVVVVPLVSDSKHEKEERVVTDNTATKDNVRAVLALLAGQRLDDGRVKQIPGATEIREARPEDLVLLSFSTHGYNGTDGQFYLLPSDTGPEQDRVTDAFLRRCISTDDLSRWLRKVDAGEMVMIVDACHSAGSVEQEGFKPGPMGSRGLGQLAYNKRMRILAASQAADVAFEDAKIGHGLLTYALCQNGLEEGRADFAPTDGRITLREWLSFGVKRVPELAEEIAAGKLRAASLKGRDLQVGEAERGMIFNQGRRSIAQHPSLFDFSKASDGLVLRDVPTSERKDRAPQRRQR